MAKKSLQDSGQVDPRDAIPGVTFFLYFKIRSFSKFPQKNLQFHISQVVLVSELYANLMQKRAKGGSRDAFIIENLYISKHIIPYIPTDIKRIKYIDKDQESISTSTSSMELHSCRFCHSRFTVSHQNQPTDTTTIPPFT